MGAVVNEGCDAVFLLVAGTWFVACVTLIAAGFMNFLWQRELHDNNADSPVPLGPRFDFWPRRRWRTDVNWYKALLGNGRPGPGETYRKWAKRLFLISIVLLIAFLALATTAAVGSSANYLRSARASAKRAVISHAACVVPTSTPMPSQLTVCRFARVFQRQVRLQRDIATSELCHRGRSAERGRSTRLCRDSAEVGSSTCGRDTFGARARSPRRPTRDGGYGMDGSAESGRTTCSG